MFPHDAVPDGDVLAPHHLYLAVLAALFVCWLVSDDRTGRETWVVAGGALAALFAFLFVWRHYPVVGAVLSLAGLFVALAAVVGRPYWWEYQLLGFRGAALVSVAVALDDVLQHAVGTPTPLDELWRRWLFPAVRWIEAAV